MWEIHSADKCCVVICNGKFWLFSIHSVTPTQLVQSTFSTWHRISFCVHWTCRGSFTFPHREVSERTVVSIEDTKHIDFVVQLHLHFQQQNNLQLRLSFSCTRRDSHLFVFYTLQLFNSRQSAIFSRNCSSFSRLFQCFDIFFSDSAMFTFYTDDLFFHRVHFDSTCCREN